MAIYNKIKTKNESISIEILYFTEALVYNALGKQNKETKKWFCLCSRNLNPDNIKKSCAESIGLFSLLMFWKATCLLESFWSAPGPCPSNQDALGFHGLRTRQATSKALSISWHKHWCIGSEDTGRALLIPLPSTALTILSYYRHLPFFLLQRLKQLWKKCN